jgi:hypothetical protein
MQMTKGNSARMGSRNNIRHLLSRNAKSNIANKHNKSNTKNSAKGIIISLALSKTGNSKERDGKALQKERG